MNNHPTTQKLRPGFCHENHENHGWWKSQIQASAPGFTAAQLYFRSTELPSIFGLTSSTGSGATPMGGRNEEKEWQGIAMKKSLWVVYTYQHYGHDFASVWELFNVKSGSNKMATSGIYMHLQWVMCDKSSHEMPGQRQGCRHLGPWSCWALGGATSTRCGMAKC